MYKIYFTNHFTQQLKPYLKKHHRLRDDLVIYLKNFTTLNTAKLGQKLYKIRFSPSSFHRGKSKAFRIIILLLETKNTIIPITLYFKSVRETMNRQEIKHHLRIVLGELNHAHL